MSIYKQGMHLHMYANMFKGVRVMYVQCSATFAALQGSHYFTKPSDFVVSY